jgi:co-chaperonin GroES (HSP10)
MTKIKFQPFGARIVVLPDKQEETTSGGILTPETTRKPKSTGVVVAVDVESISETCNRLGKAFGHQTTVKDIDEARWRFPKIGDRVHFMSHGGTDLTIDGVAYKIFSQGEILGREI